MKVYLDYAATSPAKPPEVMEAMSDFMQSYNANPGRGGYERSLQAGRLILAARDNVARFFGAERPEQIAFTLNVTMALNMAISGLVREGDHVLISNLEHNAVYRPVHALARQGTISYDVVACDENGITDPQDVLDAIRPNTRMLVVSHASNVCGAIFPLEEVLQALRGRDVFAVVDTAQTAGILPLDSTQMDVLAFTGHKHLLGPNGTGGFVLSPRAAKAMQPLLRGGTGSASHLAEQPDFMPDKFESGTINTMGILGLSAAIDVIRQTGLGTLREREQALTRRLLSGMADIPGLDLYGPRDAKHQTGTVAFNLQDVDNSELCYVLDRNFGVMGRPGLHCSPLGHRALGTFPRGVMRLSLGYDSTQEEIDHALHALRNIAQKLAQ